MVFAAQASLVFRDKGGNMSIENYTSSSFDVKDGEYAFVVSGKAVKGVWQTKGLVITTAKIEGTAIRGAKGLDLKQATMSGNVHVVVTQPSTVKGSNTNQTVRLTSNSATYTSSNSNLVLLGEVRIKNTDKADARSMILTGSSATVTLNLNAKSEADRVSYATVKGLVEFDLKGQRKETNSETKKVSVLPVYIKGHANLLTYSASERTLVLTGNVELDGSDPIFGSQIRGVDKAVVKLDAKWNVTHVDLTGNPGKTTINREEEED
jgi:lipopolysaccharide export system protein LptA